MRAFSLRRAVGWALVAVTFSTAAATFGGTHVIPPRTYAGRVRVNF